MLANLTHITAGQKVRYTGFNRIPAVIIRGRTEFVNNLSLLKIFTEIFKFQTKNKGMFFSHFQETVKCNSGAYVTNKPGFVK